jgi:hypothetical protein
MPGFFSPNCRMTLAMRAALPGGGRGCGLSDELDQRLEHLRLAGEVAVERGLAHVQARGQRGGGDALGARLLQHAGEHLQDLVPSLARLGSLAGRGGGGRGRGGQFGVHGRDASSPRSRR